jgi:hypothetical protein
MLTASEADAVRVAISQGEEADVVSCIPGKALQFTLANYLQLAALRVLERNWMAAYVHAQAPDLAHVPLNQLKTVFDACDRDILQKDCPIYGGDRQSNWQRFSLFRGCAGPDHRKGMSWTSSLDKAIWYASHHVAIHAARYPHLPTLNNVAVYAASVSRSEIYCCANHYDLDYIVHPTKWWRVNVPVAEFRLDRPR